MSSAQRKQPVQSPTGDMLSPHSCHGLFKALFFWTESYWGFLYNILVVTNMCCIVAFMEKFESPQYIIVPQWKWALGSIHSFQPMKITQVPGIRRGRKSLCMLLCSGNIACWPPARPELLQRFSGAVERDLSNRNKILSSLVSAKNRPGNFWCSDMLYKLLLSSLSRSADLKAHFHFTVFVEWLRKYVHKMGILKSMLCFQHLLFW